MVSATAARRAAAPPTHRGRHVQYHGGPRYGHGYRRPFRRHRLSYGTGYRGRATGGLPNRN